MTKKLVWDLFGAQDGESCAMVRNDRKKNRINGIELRDGRWKMWWGQEKREYDISKDIWAVFLVDFFSNMREKTSTRALCDKIDTIGEILSLLSEDSMFCEFDSAFMTCASCLYDISEAIDQQWKIFRTKGWTIVISIAKSEKKHFWFYSINKSALPTASDDSISIPKKKLKEHDFFRNNNQIEQQHQESPLLRMVYWIESVPSIWRLFVHIHRI